MRVRLHTARDGLRLPIVSSFVLLFAFEAGTPTRRAALTSRSSRAPCASGIAAACRRRPRPCRSPPGSSSGAPHCARPFPRRLLRLPGRRQGLLMALLVGWLVTAVDERAAERRAARVEEAEDAAGRAGPPRRPARRRQPLRAGAQLVARPRRGDRRVRRRAARCRAVRADGDRRSSTTTPARVIATAGALRRRGDAAGTVMDARAEHARPTSWRAARRSSGRDLELAEYAEEPRLRALGMQLARRRAAHRRRRRDRADLARSRRARRVRRARDRADRACSAASSPPRSRTSAPTKPSAGRSRS